MKNIKLFDLERQYHSLKLTLEKKVNEVLRSGQYIMGKNVVDLEKNVSQYMSTKYAISCNSGTDALIISLRALGVKRGDEVITTPFTYFATAEAIILVGAKPIFVDINPETFNIDESQIEKAISKKTKAVMPVHIFGQPCRIDVIKQICKKYKLKLIEDCAQSFGSKLNKKHTGTFGDFGCLSFFPTKNLGCAGDGGMILTNSASLAKKAMMLRNHGGVERNVHKMIGYNSRLDEIQAVILLEKMKIINKLNKSRRKIANKYSKLIDNQNITTPFEESHVNHVYHQYTLLVNDRKKFIKHMSDKNIPTGIYYPRPIYEQSAIKSSTHKKYNLVNISRICNQCVSIPMYPELTNNEIEFISDHINRYLA